MAVSLLWRSPHVIAVIVSLCAFLFGVAPVSAGDLQGEQAGAPTAKPPQLSPRPTNTTADHSKFEALKGPFTDGSQVTKACLTCHNEAGHQFMKSIHWTWEYKNAKTGQTLGKHNLVNNFCTNARGNEGMCAMCHASYNWKATRISTSRSRKISIASSATSGPAPITSSRPRRAMRPAASCSRTCSPSICPRWRKVSAMPERNNCGTCHFNGGGGDGVKHGDLD